VAEGRIQAAQARVAQYTQREQFAKDTIREEVQDAISALTTASQRLRLSQQELLVTRQLEQAERTKFDLGEGTLFLLNLREQATLEAAVRNVTALADHQRAVAAYRYSMADL
ncbi:MAG: TolC family protein, partial [Janthinobacterium lividum]